MMKLRSLLLAGFLFVSLPSASSFAQIGISVNFAPPVLPVYEQPACPAPGYIWTPGYWGWGGWDYYWVPGVWVAPPSVGLLWTPPWWGWNNGVYVFNQGYWGPTVGFYGGLNYGHGYWGDGYWGGRWDGNVFRYNTAVTRVNTKVVHNTFVDRSVVNKQVNRNRAAFNGPNGVKAEPTAQQKAAAQNARKMPPTERQLARQEAASKDRDLQASVNKGKPKPDAVKSFNKRRGTDHGAGAGEPGAGAGVAKAEKKPANLSERANAGRARPESAASRPEARAKKLGAESQANRRNLQGNQAKARSGKPTGYEGPAQAPRAMTQKSRPPQMGARNRQMGGKPPQMGAKRAQPSGQQQPKKKQGKPEERRGRP